MHNEAHAWVERYAFDDKIAALDLGGRDVNGTVHGLFPGATWTVLDIWPGYGVDIVADAATWKPPDEWDLVVATELFEHAEHWPQIVRTAFEALRLGGQFIATMAGPGRPLHSGVDGVVGRLLPGETYTNVQPRDLLRELRDTGFADIVVDQQFNPCDVRCYAVKPA